MLSVDIIPALRDNYVFLLHEKESGRTVVIDPGEAEPVLAALEERSWQLHYVWNTHHHADHVGGNDELVRQTGCEVWASKYDVNRISPQVRRGLDDGEIFYLGKIEVQVWHIPGHTLGHIAFYLPLEKKIFVGDTLFSFGCGRIFEGTYEQMYSSLQRFNELPEDVEIYCGHEYTLKNLEFCLQINDSLELRKVYQQTQERILHKGSSIPSQISAEKKWNPFLKANSLQKFKELRLKKDVWS